MSMAHDGLPSNIRVVQRHWHRAVSGMRTSDDGISVLPKIRTDGHHTGVLIFLPLRNQSVRWELESDVPIFASEVSL
jgi:hypothetical protein